MYTLLDVTNYLNESGLSDRYDAYEVFTHMDAFVKKAGIKSGGGKCGRGWVGIKGSCDRMKRGGDRAALQKQSLNKFAVSQRSKKDLPEKGFVALRRSIAGKGGHPAGSPADQKEKLRAKFGGYGDVANRTERLQRKEEQRSIVSQGGLKQRKANAAIGPQEFDYVNPSKKVAKSETDRTPAQKHVDKKVANLMAQDLRGDLSREQQYRIALKGFAKQAESAETPEERKSGAVLRDRMQSALDINDKFKAKQKKEPTPIEQGKSLKQLFGEADAIGPKSEPMTMAERRSAKQGADKILGETGYTEAAARASGKVRSIGSGKAALTTESVNPFNAKQGRQFAEQQGAQAKAEGRSADAKKWQDEAKLKSRSELATLMQGKSANQQNLFGVTEHASDMPLFNQPTAAPTSTRSKAPKSSPTADLTPAQRHRQKKSIATTAQTLKINPSSEKKYRSQLESLSRQPDNKKDAQLAHIIKSALDIHDSLKAKGESKFNSGEFTTKQEFGKSYVKKNGAFFAVGDTNVEAHVSADKKLKTSEKSNALADRRRALADRVNQGPADKDLQRAIDNAPVSIPNSRKSSEPRRRGRSVD